MRAAASLACLTLLAACGRSTEADAQSALTFSPDLAERFAALPRVKADSPQARAINARLDLRDALDRESRSECLAMKPENDNVEWERSVEAPMTGPRFISLLITTNSYCGGAHGNGEQTSMTFDLSTGETIDWSTMLPQTMALPRYEATAHWPQLLRSRSLKVWYGQQASEQRRQDNGEGDCAEVLLGDEPLDAWLDAEKGGLALRVVGLADAASACAETVLMSPSELRQRGVAAELVTAIEDAHRDGRWRRLPH